MEAHARGMQVSRLIVVCGAHSSWRWRVISRRVCEVLEGEGVGLQDGRSKSPIVVRIPGSLVWVFALIMVGEVSAKTTCIVSRLIHVNVQQLRAESVLRRA